MENKWKFILYIVIFVVVLNAVGIWAVESRLFQNDNKSNRVFTVENIKIKLVNKNGYDKKIVDQIERSIKNSVKDIIKVTNGKLTPKTEVKILLVKSEKTAEMNRPAYATSTIFNPDKLYIEDWNFNEMMLHTLFDKSKTLNPFQTIGLAEYLLYQSQKGEYYSSHELWIIHSRYNTPSSLEDLIQANVFKRRVLKIVEIEGHNAFTESGYWKDASFANFLIEKYGVEKFLLLYNSEDVKQDIEKIYGKSLSEIEADWTRYLNEIENSLPEKYNRELEEDYQYWYEN